LSRGVDLSICQWNLGGSIPCSTDPHPDLSWLNKARINTLARDRFASTNIGWTTAIAVGAPFQQFLEIPIRGQWAIQKK
jgi:hypothetical protein